MHISRILFLFSSLFLGPLPVNSNRLDLCGSPLLSSFQSIYQATSEFLPPVFQPVNSLKAVGWDSHKVPRLLLYFSWVTIHYCLRFSISKTTVFYILSNFFTYFRHRVSHVLVITSLEKGGFSFK